MWSSSTELLTLVSQKMCVVVYPMEEGDLETEGRSEDMAEQRQSFYQPAPTKDQDSDGQLQA